MLTDDEVSGILRGRIFRANNYLDNKLAEERIRVTEYMDGLAPRPMHKGNSKYVSSDVFDSVEGLKAQLIETFAGTHQTVRFLPQAAPDVEPARISTEVVNYAVHVQNPGFQVFNDVIHDGLTARMGVVKVWWEKDEKESEEQFEGDTDDFAAYLARNPDAEVGDATQDPDGTIAATITNKSDTSQVKIEVIPPDEFLYTGRSRSFADAELLAHRTTKTVSELISMGFDPETVRECAGGTDWLYHSREVISRTRMEDPMSRIERDDEEAGREIEVYECFTKLDMTGKGRAGRRLWQILFAGDKVLSKQEVKRSPFLGFIPLSRPHTIQGENFAARVIPTQNSRTALMRAIIDHATITTNPRYTVLRNGLMDPRELLENRVGGVVNITKPDAVGVLQQAALNPFVFQTIQQLDLDREEVTGVSKLSQGLNKDAISQQNSGQMVEQLVTLSQVRQKVIARRFGEFVKSLYLLAHQLIIENADKQFSIEVAGNWVQVDPSFLKNREHITLDVSLGYGEKEKEAQKFVMMDTYLSKDPRLSRMYDDAHRYTVLSRAMEAMGVKDVSSVIVDPKTLPPPQPDPMAQLNMAKLKAEVDLTNAQAQAAIQKVQHQMQAAQMEHQLRIAQMQQDIQQSSSKMALEARKQDFKEAIDTAELRLAVETQENAQTMIQTPKV